MSISICSSHASSGIIMQGAGKQGAGEGEGMEKFEGLED
jgi:hypothetical protein